jgi:uncharacterized C2H2 Zn-finger protein
MSKQAPDNNSDTDEFDKVLLNLKKDILDIEEHNERLTKNIDVIKEVPEYITLDLDYLSMSSNDFMDFDNIPVVDIVFNENNDDILEFTTHSPQPQPIKLKKKVKQEITIESEKKVMKEKKVNKITKDKKIVNKYETMYKNKTLNESYSNTDVTTYMDIDIDFDSDNEYEYDYDLDLVNKINKATKNKIKPKKLTDDIKIEDIEVDYSNINDENNFFKEFTESTTINPYKKLPTIHVNKNTYYENNYDDVGDAVYDKYFKSKQYSKTKKSFKPPKPIKPTSTKLSTTKISVKTASKIYNCPRCELTFDSQTSMNNHYMYSHSFIATFNSANSANYGNATTITNASPSTSVIKYGPTSLRSRNTNNESPAEMCRCVVCDIVFISDISFKAHLCFGKAIKNSIIESNLKPIIPTNPNGKYACPVCQNKYSSPNLLGEHFISEHDSYEELGVLDKKSEDISTLGFPGFDLLEYIKMIIPITEEETDDLIKQQDTCPICMYFYKRKEEEEPEQLLEDHIAVDYYNSDTETLLEEHVLELNPENRYMSDSETCIKPKHKRRQINNTDLVDKINQIKKYERLPLKLTCCNYLMCYDCLKHGIQLSDNISIICPFCKKNHAETDEDYIIFIEECDVCDPLKWNSWWRKHVDLFY